MLGEVGIRVAEERNYRFTLHIHENPLKMSERLKPKTPNHKSHERRHGETLDDIGLGHDFMHMIPKAQATERKISTWGHITRRSVYTAKETIDKMQRQPTNWERVFSNHVIR